MAPIEIMSKVAAVAGQKLEYDSRRLGEVSIVCQLAGGGTLCWSDIDEHTCGVSITMEIGGKIQSLSSDLRYDSLDADIEAAFQCS